MTKKERERLTERREKVLQQVKKESACNLLDSAVYHVTMLRKCIDCNSVKLNNDLLVRLKEINLQLTWLRG